MRHIYYSIILYYSKGRLFIPVPGISQVVIINRKFSEYAVLKVCMLRPRYTFSSFAIKPGVRYISLRVVYNVNVLLAIRGMKTQIANTASGLILQNSYSSRKDIILMNINTWYIQYSCNKSPVQICYIRFTEI